jgi:hypothetical protein
LHHLSTRQAPLLQLKQRLSELLLLLPSVMP